MKGKSKHLHNLAWRIGEGEPRTYESNVVRLWKRMPTLVKDDLYTDPGTGFERRCHWLPWDFHCRFHTASVWAGVQMGALCTVDTPTVISGCGLLVVLKGCFQSFDILRHFKFRNCWVCKGQRERCILFSKPWKFKIQNLLMFRVFFLNVVAQVQCLYPSGRNGCLR